MVAIWFILWALVLNSPAITSGPHGPINAWGILLAVCAFIDVIARIRAGHR